MSGHLGERLTALIDGELGHDEREKAHRHLAACADCRAEAEALRGLKKRLRALNDTMPSLSAEDVRRLTLTAEGSTLVLLCPEEAPCADATAALRRAGLTTQERARIPLSARGLLDLNVLVVDVWANPAGP